MIQQNVFDVNGTRHLNNNIVAISHTRGEIISQRKRTRCMYKVTVTFAAKKEQTLAVNKTQKPCLKITKINYQEKNENEKTLLELMSRRHNAMEMETCLLFSAKYRSPTNWKRVQT